MAFTDDSTKLLVAVKAYARGNALPLDNSEVYASKALAEAYAQNNGTAYAGQTIKVLEDGKYITYVLDPKAEGAGYNLTKVGVDQSIVTDVAGLKTDLDLAEEKIAEHAAAIGVPAAEDKEASGLYKLIADEVVRATQSEAGLNELIDALNVELGNPVELDPENEGEVKNPASGVYKLIEDAVKNLTSEITSSLSSAQSYTDEKVSALVDGAPDTLDTLNELAAALKDNKDIVDTINASIALKADKSTVEELAQTVSTDKQELLNAIGALQTRATNLEKADETINGEIDSLEELINANTTAINNEKTRAEGKEAELLESINGVSGDLESAVSTLNEEIAKKATAADLEVLAGRVTANESALSSKVNVADFNTSIGELETEISNQELELKEYISGRIGEIPETTTIKSYIDTAVGSGGSASAEAIAQAKQEAINTSKTYTDEKLSWIKY